MKRNNTPKARDHRAQGAVCLAPCLIIMMAAWVWPLYGDIAVIPGDVNRICHYTDFFYNYPSEDFFYYLNERLLFTDTPDGIIEGSGLRNKLLKIVRWHRIIKKSLQRIKMKETDIITINVADPEGYKKVTIIMNLLGLRLDRSPGGQYRVTRDSSLALKLSDYFQFAVINPGTLENQLNKTHHFHLKIDESEIPVPWDFEFLQEITGLEIDSASFFETMLKNERFSLLLGVLYRLSHKEINHISNLVKKPRLGAWKWIYKYKRFLMGMFFLSNALRVTADDDDEDGQWVLPGGRAAEPFWNQLTGKNYKKYPLGFLYRLATKDEGKLNYLFLFSQFLSPESQKTLFTGANAKKMQRVYHLISLNESEKLKAPRFPRLRDFNFYTLLYSLRMRDNRFYFPMGVDVWLKMNQHRILASFLAGISIPDISETSEVSKVVDEKVIISQNVEKIKEIRKFMEKSKLALAVSEEKKGTVTVAVEERMEETEEEIFEPEDEIFESEAEIFEESLEEEDLRKDIDVERRKISVDMGVKVGLCASNLNFSQDTIKGWKTTGNFLLGTFFTFNISKKVVIQPEVYYAVKGAAFSNTYGGESFKQKVKLNYIEVPLLVKVNLPVKGVSALFAGFYGALNIGSTAITRYAGETRKESIRGEIQGGDFGLVGGTSIDFRMGTRKLILDLRYSTSLQNIRKSVFTNYKVKNSVFYCIIGYTF